VAHEFEREAAGMGERVCYFGAGTRLESALRAGPRRSTVLLGSQPVWDPAHWPAIVARRASLRAQLNRARNKGVRVREMDAEQASRDPTLARVLHAWLATRGLPPLHFLVEPDTLSTLADRRVFVAVRDGAAVGYLVASPVPQRDGWLVEQIIRGRGAANGTNELLVDAAMRALADSRAAYVTLGLAPLSTRASVSEEGQVPHPLWLRVVLAWTRLHGRRFYNFDGLDAFKAKLQPDEWEPIFAISVERRFSVRTLYAIAAAFSAGSPVLLVARAVATAVLQEVRRARAQLAASRQRAPEASTAR
jgi:phosphatidylglycerol lysyltransferase